jgi:hypothetical protein
MSCTGITCNQGRVPGQDGCHKRQRTCAELGVCQGRTPACSDDCENPLIVPGGLPAMRLITENSDGSSPHAEARDLIDIALDGALVLLVLAALVFTLFAAIGFWSAR